MRLHLGCGQVYLDGYINIDYPKQNHTVQDTQLADKFADITKLRYKKNRVEEVRLHHVYEHFPRAQAIALIQCWNSWLMTGGSIIIEVPDFEKMIKYIVNPISSKKIKYVASRHIFGSQEADWALHYDGWTKNRLIEIANLAGFSSTVSRSSSHKYIHNITLNGIKTKSFTKKIARDIAFKYLEKFMVDDSQTERKMIDQWLKVYDDQINKSWAI